MNNAKTAFFPYFENTNIFNLNVGPDIRKGKCCPAYLPVAAAPDPLLSLLGDPPYQQAIGQKTLCFL